jgi:hypothetical protein
LAEHNNCHAMDIDPQVTDADAKNGEWGNDAAVDGDTMAESSVPQRGDGPKNNCDRGGHGINARESLIDLKDAVDHNLPLVRSVSNIADHVLHEIRDGESADRRGDHDGNASEAVGDDGGEGDPVGGGNAPCQAASGQEQQEDAHHSERVRGTGDDRQMRDLVRSLRGHS